MSAYLLKNLPGRILLLALLLASTISFADSHDHLEDELFTDDNLLIVNLMLGKYTLASDLFIYATPEVTLIPLQPLLDGLEFPIQVDPVAQKASGWFLRESNYFDLNAERRMVIIDGETIAIPHDALLLSDGFDLYVELNLIAQWFPVTAQLNIGKLQLQLDSTTDLPVELQLAREKERRKNQQLNNNRNLPHHDDHYRLLGSPVIDVNLGAIAQKGGSSSANHVEFDRAYSVQGNMDILKMQGSFSANRASTEVDSVKRLTLYKRPNNPQQTMPGKIGYAAVGDVYGVSDALVLNGGSGLGAELQFGGSQKTTDFGKRAIEGEAAPRWEVELYRNNALIDFMVVGNDGRYRFEDVPVEYGENVFDIRLFGPQGQERTRRESIRVGAQALPAGKFFAQASHVNLGKSVFDSESDALQSNSVIEEKKTYLQVQAGVTNWLSASAGYIEHANVDLLQNSENYMQGGLNFSLPKATLGLQYAEQQDHGYAALLNTQFQLSSTAFSYTHKYYSDFSSDRNPNATLDNDIELRLTGNASGFGKKPWSYQLLSNYQEDQYGNYNYRVESRLGTGLLRGRATIETTYNNDSNENQIIGGGAHYIRSIGSKTNIRAALNYSIDPDWELRGASNALTWRHNRHATVQLSVNTDFTSDDNNSLDASYTYEFSHFTLSANTAVREGGDYSFFLNLEFSLAQESNHQWKISPTPQAHYGRLDATVFLDNNANGEFDSGDEPLPDIRFSGFSNWNTLQTDQNGRVFLSGLRSAQSSRVKFEHNSLIDPYWKSSFDQALFTAHAGGLHEIQIPVVATVEVEGNIVLVNGNQQRPLSGLPIIVTDQAERQIAQVVSEFDGYFVIDNLMPGSYQLKIDAAALRQLGLGASPAISFVARPSDGVIYLDTIRLEKANDSANPITAKIGKAIPPNTLKPPVTASTVSEPKSSASNASTSTKTIPKLPTVAKVNDTSGETKTSSITNFDPNLPSTEPALAPPLPQAHPPNNETTDITVQPAQPRLSTLARRGLPLLALTALVGWLAARRW